MISGVGSLECTSDRLIYLALKQQFENISSIRRLNITAVMSIMFTYKFPTTIKNYNNLYYTGNTAEYGE